MGRPTVRSLEEGLDALLDDPPAGVAVVVADVVPAWLPALASAADAAGREVQVVLAPAATAVSDEARAGWEVGVLTTVLALRGVVVQGAEARRVRRVQAVLDRLAVHQEATA